MRFLFLFIFLICCCWGFSQKISNDIIPFKKENKWGLCYKSSDSIIAKPVYSKIEGFFIHESDSSHLIYNVFTSNKMGLANSYGKLCIDTIYNTIAPINEYKYNTYEIIGEPRFLVSINNKYGIVNFNGGTQLPLKFADIREYPIEYNDTTLNLYEAITNDSVFFYDKTNSLLLSLKSGPNTDIIEYYAGNWIFRITDNKNIDYLGMINDKGKIIVNAMYRSIYPIGKYQQNPNILREKRHVLK